MQTQKYLEKVKIFPPFCLSKLKGALRPCVLERVVHMITCMKSTFIGSMERKIWTANTDLQNVYHIDKMSAIDSCEFLAFRTVFAFFLICTRTKIIMNCNILEEKGRG